MAKITPQITFSKDKFIYGKDTYIEGTIVLQGVDMSQIKNISVEHVVWYGVSSNDKKPLEGFDHSSKKVLGTFPVPIETLAFSIPLLYPNIKKTDGASYDGENALIQNNLGVHIHEKSFFTLDDHENVIIPIEWGALTDTTINNSELREIFDTDEDEDDTIEDEMTQISPGSIALPWNELDVVSESYYKNILDTHSFARLGDTLYRNKILVTLKWLSIMGLILSFVFLVMSGSSTSPEFQSISGTISLLLFLGCSLYLFLQSLPKSFLKKKVSIDTYIPHIQTSKVLTQVLLSNTVHIKDLFQEVLFQPNSPLISQKGSLSMNFDLSCSYTYPSGKSSYTHEQMLLNGNVFHLPFSSFDSVFQKEVSIPNWVVEAIGLSDKYRIGFKKKILLNLVFDTLPDKEYELVLKAPIEQ